MAKFTNEMKTGIVVIAAVVLLGIMVAMVGDYHLFDKGYSVKVVFDYTNGVDKNAPIRLAGVDVGEVTDVRLQYGDKTQVLLTLYMEPWAKIREDSKVYSTTLGLMGEKYIEITPGSEGVAFVKPGSTMIGENPVRIEELIKSAEQIADNIDKTLVDVQKLAKNLNSAVEGNRPKLDSIFDNLEVSSENLKEFTQDIKWHPWKLLRKGKERKTPEEEKKEQEEQAERQKRQWQ